MATGNNAQQAAEEQQRREKNRLPLDSGLDEAEQHRPLEVGELQKGEPFAQDVITAAGYGACGILGEL